MHQPGVTKRPQAGSIEAAYAAAYAAARCLPPTVQIVEKVHKVLEHLWANHTVERPGHGLYCKHCNLEGVDRERWEVDNKNNRCAIQRHLFKFHKIVVMQTAGQADSSCPSESPHTLDDSFVSETHESVEIECVRQHFQIAARSRGFELTTSGTGWESHCPPDRPHTDFPTFVSENKIRKRLFLGAQRGYEDFLSLLSTINGYLRFRFQYEWKPVDKRAALRMPLALSRIDFASQAQSVAPGGAQDVAPNMANAWQGALAQWQLDWLICRKRDFDWRLSTDSGQQRVEPAAAKPGVARGRGDDTTPPPTVDQPQVVEAAVQNRARLPPRNGDVVDTAAATGGQAQTAEEPLTPDDGSAVDGAAAQAEGGGGSGPPASPTRAGAAGALPSPPATPRREKLAADNASPGSLPEKGRPTTATEGGGKEAAAAATLRALVAGKLGAPIGSSSGQSVRDEDRGPKLPVFNNARPDLVIIMREGEHDPSDPLVKAVLSWIDKHPSRKLSESRAHAFVVEPSGKHVLVVGSGYHWQNGLEYESGSTRKRLNIEKDAAGDCSLCGQDHWELQCPKMPLHRLVVPEWRRQESTTERIYDAAPAPAPPSSPQQGTESDAARWREGTPPAVAAATRFLACDATIARAETPPRSTSAAAARLLVPEAPMSPPATPRREQQPAASPPPYSARAVFRGPALAVFGGASADRVIFWGDASSRDPEDSVVQKIQAWIAQNPGGRGMYLSTAHALKIRSTGERVLVLGSSWENGPHGLRADTAPASPTINGSSKDESIEREETSVNLPLYSQEKST
ncbi:hypothetical protein DFJ73DRAFT_802952 [Zopfochytrium polystomum]|nr:hypothetical protein DFJ73DRAFT_802952 [Zopfochytrium polystomum]